MSYPNEGSWFEKLISNEENKGSYLDSQIQQEFKALLGDLYEPLMEIRQTLKGSSRMQARMLDDVRVK